MFGQLYEAPQLTFSGVFLLFAIQVAAILFYKQASRFYREHQQQQLHYVRYKDPTTPGIPVPPAGPAGPANGAR